MMDFDNDPFGYKRFEDTPPGPLQAWKDGPFVGVVKGDTTIMRLNQMDRDSLSSNPTEYQIFCRYHRQKV